MRGSFVKLKGTKPSKITVKRLGKDPSNHRRSTDLEDTDVAQVPVCRNSVWDQPGNMAGTAPKVAMAVAAGSAAFDKGR